MYKGQIVEKSPTEELLTNPQHEYTKTLIANFSKTNYNF